MSAAAQPLNKAYREDITDRFLQNDSIMPRQPSQSGTNSTDSHTRVASDGELEYWKNSMHPHPTSRVPAYNAQ